MMLYKEKFVQFCKKFVLGLTGIILIFLTYYSLLSTSVLDPLKVETIVYVKDNIPLLILAALLLGIGIICLGSLLKTWQPNVVRWRILVSIFVFILGIGWIFLNKSLPFADGLMIDQAIDEFAVNDYSQLAPNGYFGKFPFQLNFMMFLQCLYSFVGNHNYIFLQALNVVSLIITILLVANIAGRVFKSTHVEVITLLLSALFLPLIFYCSFIYSTIYGLLFSTISLYFMIRYMETHNMKYSFGIILPLLLAVTLKSNYLIILIAILCMLVMDMIANKKIAPVVIIVLLLIGQMIPGRLIKSYYQNATGMEISKGIPSIAWVAMGMENGPKAPGWYNKTMFKSYKKAKYNSEETAELSKKNITQRLDYFKDNPNKALVFYRDKTISQWNEPTFESLWVTYHGPHMKKTPISSFQKTIFYGKLNKVYLIYTNFYHLIILLFAILGIYICWKRHTYAVILFAVIFLGGFFFHTLWEANSKYTITYFLMLVPYAASGICLLLNLTKKGEVK